MNDPVTVTLFEWPPCCYGCAGCLVCRPQVALTPEGAAAFVATGLVTVTPTSTPGVFALAATEDIGCPVQVDGQHVFYLAIVTDVADTFIVQEVPPEGLRIVGPGEP